MIDKILDIIKEQFLESNPFLDRMDINCIRLETGEIVADYNRNEINSGAEDMKGVGSYIRYNGIIEYSPVTRKRSSCKQNYDVSVPMRLVIYNFNDSKEFNMIRLEEKVSNALMVISFAAHNGFEKSLSIELTSSNPKSDTVWINEIGKEREADNFFQMLSVDFNLKFVKSEVSPECFESCDVFNNEEKC